MTKAIDHILTQEFVCPKCKHVGAHVERLAMSGTGISRFMDIQHHKYAFASCLACGYTEIYNLKILANRKIKTT
jgi:predicted nucleic-acid-binding Zn-ribbon protein